MTATSLAALAALLVVAPALPGIAARTTARLTGRRGPPIFQLYSDLRRLLSKGTVYSRTTTAVFRLAPVGLLAGVLLAASWLPLDGRAAPLGFAGDLFAFAAVLAFGRALVTLAGFDTGSSFEGMGSSRELAIATFSEPALFLALGALALATGRLSLGEMLGPAIADAWWIAPATLAMIAVSLFVVLLAEASRGPVDDPTTHLELTMIHEVMILDHSGPDLALLLYASSLKFALFGALVIGVLVPRGAWPAPIALTGLLAGLAAVAVAIGVLESVMARLKLLHVPQLLVAAAALSTLGVFLLLR